MSDALLKKLQSYMSVWLHLQTSARKHTNKGVMSQRLTGIIRIFHSYDTDSDLK